MTHCSMLCQTCIHTRTRTHTHNSSSGTTRPSVVLYDIHHQCVVKNNLRPRQYLYFCTSKARSFVLVKQVLFCSESGQLTNCFTTALLRFTTALLQRCAEEAHSPRI